MQLESLKVFCDVVRHRSFSQAAEESGITQSAVSQIVSHLEKRMNVQLIDRSTRPLQLTPVGLAYYEGCKQLIDAYEKLEARIRNARVTITGNVTIAAIYSVGLGDMGQYVQRFQAELPKSPVHIDYVHPDRVYERVMDGTADLGLVSYPKKAAHLVSVAWRDEEMVLACSPKHYLASRQALPLRELTGLNYVHFDRGLVIRRRVDRFLREQGASVNVVAEFDSIENIKQAVSIGAGVALLPEPTIRREVKARTLAAIPLSGCSFTRPLAIIHRRGNRLSAAAKRFMDLLLEPNSSPQKNGKHRSGK
ncbi:MAG: LysR family transcriptional regulator [Planctomycetes bacterium]|nr:LysR family transcriptional regulator [Planctomycetota bacterium]